MLKLGIVSRCDFEHLGEERIYHDAGSDVVQGLRRTELLRLIREAGREPVERDTAYRRVERKDETSFAILV